MKLIRTIRQDLVNGFRNSRSRRIFFLAFFILICTIKVIDMSKYISPGQRFGICGFLARGILGGVLKVSTGINEPIDIPIEWITTMLFIPYIIGDFINSDMQGFGQHRMIKTGRVRWWIGKMVWLLANTCTFACYFYFIPLAVVYIARGDLVELEWDSLMYTSEFSIMSDKDFIILAVVMPVLCMLAISFVTMFISLCTNSSVAFMCVSIYLMLGVFICNNAFIGNQMMLLRNRMLEPEGIDVGTSIAVDIILIIGCLFGSFFYVKNKDFIQKNVY